MTDLTGFDGWYNEVVRRLTSADGVRVAVRYSGGWDLAVVFSERGTTMSNPFGLHSGVACDRRDRISDESAIAYVQAGTMPSEYVDLPREAEDETLLARIRAKVAQAAETPSNPLPADTQ